MAYNFLAKSQKNWMKKILHYKNDRKHSSSSGKKYFIKRKTKKELSLNHKLWFSNKNIFAIRFRRRWKFQTMNSVRSNSLSLKYQGFPPLVCQDKRIGKFEFVAKTQFLYSFQASIYSMS